MKEKRVNFLQNTIIAKLNQNLCNFYNNRGEVCLSCITIINTIGLVLFCGQYVQLHSGKRLLFILENNILYSRQRYILSHFQA